MNNKIVIRNREPQEIKISGGGEVLGITAVYVNGIDVTEGNVAYVIVPTKLSELENNMHFISEEVDPTVPYYVKQITQADINKWNNKQDLLVSGTNIKTINGNSIIGSGNIEISTDYTAGTGIEITEENVINNTITSYDDLTDLPTIPDSTSQLLNDSGYVTSEELSEVAFTGSYVSLSNTPTVVSEFINDANYVDMSFIWNMLPKLTSIDTTINLTPTVSNAPLKIELNPSTLTQDATPTPSSPQDIHVVSGDNTLKVIGQNIWDEEWEQGYYNSTGGKENATNAIRSKNFIKVQPNSQYYIYNGTDNNGIVNFYDKDKIFISTSSSHNQIKTTPNNCYYILFSTGTTYGGTYKNDICLNISDSSNGTYISHEEQVVNIPLGDLEYCKIGNYKDKFYLATASDTGLTAGKWYLKKNVGKVVLDGSEEDWSIRTNVDRYNSFNISINDIMPYTDGSQVPLLFINRYKIISYNAVWNPGMASGNPASPRRIYLLMEKTFNTIEVFQTWLSTHNTIVYYVLETPQYILLPNNLQEALNTLESKLLAYNEQTNISQTNGDLPFIITAETVKSLVNV